MNQPPGIPVVRVDLEGVAQGTTWHITYYSKEAVVTKRHIDSILDNIDSSLSIYKPYSRIVAFNNSTDGIALDSHFRLVAQKSIEAYQQTNGLFDITILPIAEAWGFGVRRPESLPDSSTIQLLLHCVGSHYLKLDPYRLNKLKPCVRIDVNGIAQGYSVDVLANFLEENGIANYIVELGGELRVLGKKQPGNEPFVIGIEAPLSNGVSSPALQKTLVLHRGAVTTSGNYRKYYESKGKVISHLMDPHTGYFIKNEMISVTVYAKDAITADAYDNALMAMGLSQAMKFLEKRKDLAAYMIYRLPDGNIADTASSEFYKLFKN